MKAKIHCILPTIGLVALSFGFSGFSAARTLPAFGGQPQLPADYSSFLNNTGRVVHYATSTKRYCVSLPTDGGGTYIYVTARSPDYYHQITCQGVAITKEGSIASTTSWSGPSSYNVDQQVNLGWVSIPTDGALYTCCDMAGWSVWDSVKFY